MVDADRSGVQRAQHFCADLKPSSDPHLLAVAADRHDRLASGWRAGDHLDRHLLDRLADRARVVVHDQPFLHLPLVGYRRNIETDLHIGALLSRVVDKVIIGQRVPGVLSRSSLRTLVGASTFSNRQDAPAAARPFEGA